MKDCLIVDEKYYLILYYFIMINTFSFFVILTISDIYNWLFLVDVRLYMINIKIVLGILDYIYIYDQHVLVCHSYIYYVHSLYFIMLTLKSRMPSSMILEMSRWLTVR